MPLTLAHDVADVLLRAVDDALSQAFGDTAIETVEQLTALRSQGCHDVQGYIFGRPADPAATTSLLLRHKRADHHAMLG